MPIKKKNKSPVIDSRHLKILATKKSELQNALVIVCLDEEKYGSFDKAALRKLVSQIDNIEPSGTYLPIVKKMDVQFYDKADFRNKDILITIEHEDPDEIDYDEVEAEFRKALPSAKSIDFVHVKTRIDRK